MNDNSDNVRDQLHDGIQQVAEMLDHKDRLMEGYASLIEQLTNELAEARSLLAKLAKEVQTLNGPV